MIRRAFLAMCAAMFLPKEKEPKAYFDELSPVDSAMRERLMKGKWAMRVRHVLAPGKAGHRWVKMRFIS